MDFNKDKIFELGRGFDLGLIHYEALSDSEKYALSKYYALRDEKLDNQIQDVTNSLIELDKHLDNVAQTLREIK